MIHVREIQRKDNQTMGDIIKKSLEEENLAVEGSAYYDPEIMSLSDFYTNKSREAYWVIEVDGVVAGGVGIGQFKVRKDVSELQKLYIDSGYRGHGLSHKLMEKALNFAKKYYQTCYLETFADLGVAVKLYEKYDFIYLDKPYPETQHTACDVWMEKDLKA